MQMKRIGLGVLMAVFGAAQLAFAAGPPAAAPASVPAERLVDAARAALCSYLGWFCS